MDKRSRNDILYHNKEELNRLIKEGMDIDVVNNRGRTPLMIVLSYCDHLKSVDLLIKNGANVNTVDNTGKTALMIAAMSERGYMHNVKEIILLIMNSADWTMRDNEGKTARDYYMGGNDLYDSIITKCEQSLACEKLIKAAC